MMHGRPRTVIVGIASRLTVFSGTDSFHFSSNLGCQLNSCPHKWHIVSNFTCQQYREAMFSTQSYNLNGRTNLNCHILGKECKSIVALQQHLALAPITYHSCRARGIAVMPSAINWLWCNVFCAIDFIFHMRNNLKPVNCRMVPCAMVSIHDIFD